MGQSSFLRVYASYNANYAKALLTIKQCKQQKKFNEFLEVRWSTHPTAHARRSFILFFYYSFKSHATASTTPFDTRLWGRATRSESSSWAPISSRS